MRSAGRRDSIVVLERDPDLPAGIDAADVAAATEAVVAPRALRSGKWRGGGWGPPDPRGHFGLLVTDGLLLREVGLSAASARAR